MDNLRVCYKAAILAAFDRLVDVIEPADLCDKPILFTGRQQLFRALFADQFYSVVAEQSLGGRIHVGEFALEADRDHHRARGVQNVLEGIAGIPRGCFALGREVSHHPHQHRGCQPHCGHQQKPVEFRTGFNASENEAGGHRYREHRQ